MSNREKAGLWPVMLTPFTKDGEVDFASLERLIDWYERSGVDGLFADLNAAASMVCLRTASPVKSFFSACRNAYGLHSLSNPMPMSL